MTPEQAIKELVRVELNKNQTQALTSFVADRGVSAFKNSNLLKVINRNDFDNVPHELSKWVVDAGKRSADLEQLRQKEIKLFCQ
jgi:lysozyme